MWENIAPMVEHSRYPLLNDHDLALLLERARPDLLAEPQLEFPKLTSKQRKFGVNPAYQPDFAAAAPGDDPLESFDEQQQPGSANGEIFHSISINTIKSCPGANLSNLFSLLMHIFNFFAVKIGHYKIFHL